MGAKKLGPNHDSGLPKPMELLTDCLVDGDAAANSRAGQGRRRALGFSALTQAVVVGVVLLVPLFATGSKLIGKTTVVMPPYGGLTHDPAPIQNRGTRNVIDIPPRRPLNPNQMVVPSRVPTHIDESSTGEQAIPNTSQTDRIGLPGGDPRGPGLIPGLEPGPGPKPPEAPETKAAIPRGPIEVSQISELALLIHKVEPVYPALAKLTRKEGTVQLHAIISREGKVVNLEVLSGDMLLVQSAREAVSQWRFRPTVLNGQPVEVETYITVVFRLGQ